MTHEQLERKRAGDRARKRSPAGKARNRRQKQQAVERDGERLKQRDRPSKARWQRANRDAVKAAAKRSRRAKPEHYSEYGRRWKREHRDEVCEHQATRRARTLGATVEHVDRTLVLIRDCGLCGICGLAVGPDWHLDHTIALANGGAHSYSNVRVSHPTCNMAKGAA